MRPEKRYLIDEALARVSKSENVLLVDFTGVTVADAAALRAALAEVGAEYHIVKNSILNLVAKECKLPDLGEFLAGPTAVVTGSGEISALSKAVVKFFEGREKSGAKGLDVAGVKAAVIEGEIANKDKVIALSKLPSLNELRAQLLSLFKEPSAQFVRLLVAFRKDELDALKNGAEAAPAEAAPAETAPAPAAE